MTSDSHPEAAGRPTVEQMLRRIAEEVRDPRVLDAMRAVPRAAFVPPEYRAFAYGDGLYRSAKARRSPSRSSAA